MTDLNPTVSSTLRKHHSRIRTLEALADTIVTPGLPFLFIQTETFADGDYYGFGTPFAYYEPDFTSYTNREETGGIWDVESENIVSLEVGNYLAILAFEVQGSSLGTRCRLYSGRTGIPTGIETAFTPPTLGPLNLGVTQGGGPLAHSSLLSEERTMAMHFTFSVAGNATTRYRPKAEFEDSSLPGSYQNILSLLMVKLS